MYALSRIVRIGPLAALLAAVLMFGAPAAKGQTIPCGERGAVLKQLTQQYNEKRTAFGLTEDGRLIEVMAAPQGSWTILISRPGGPTCLVSSGKDWRQIVEPPDEPLA